MENFDSTPIFLCFFLFFMILDSSSAQFIGEDACEKANCGQGKCRRPTGFSVFPFDCDCYSGWTKVQLGPLIFPPCIIPNCTLSSKCANDTPAPAPAPAPTPTPPPPPPPVPPQFNLSNPCTFILCGNGTCVPNGMQYSCQCNPGYANFMNWTSVACVKQCYLEGACRGVALGPPATPSGPNGPDSANNGWTEEPNYTMNRNVGIIVLILAILVPWI